MVVKKGEIRERGVSGGNKRREEPFPCPACKGKGCKHCEDHGYFYKCTVPLNKIGSVWDECRETCGGLFPLSKFKTTKRILGNGEKRLYVNSACRKCQNKMYNGRYRDYQIRYKMNKRQVMEAR